MNFLKRLFRRKKKKAEPECWYNNSHEKKRRRWHNPEQYTGTDPAQFEISSTNNIARRQ